MSSGNESICAMSITSTCAFPSSELLLELLSDSLETELSLDPELELSVEVEELESEPLLEDEDELLALLQLLLLELLLVELELVSAWGWAIRSAPVCTSKAPSDSTARS